MNLPPSSEQPVSPEPATESPAPLSSRLVNIFAAPGEVFDSVKPAPFAAANWVVPALIFVLASWVCSYLILRQPVFQQQIRDVTSQAIDKSLERNKKMSQEQADQVRTMAEKWAVLGTKISAVAAPPVMAVVSVFGWGLIVWIVGAKILKGPFGYLKAVEVSGLCLMISALESVIRSMLVLVTGNLWASTSPTVFMSGFDPQNTAHAALAMLNIMIFWILAVRSLGLARLSGASFAKAAAWIFGLWLAYNAFTLGLGALVRFLTSK